MSTKSKIPYDIFPTTLYIINKTDLQDAADTDKWDQFLETSISNEYILRLSGVYVNSHYNELTARDLTFSASVMSWKSELG